MFRKIRCPLELPKSGSINLDTNQVEWSPGGRSGFHYKHLVDEQVANQRSYLMKVDAGAFSPMHAHEEIEQIYVLEGSLYDQDNTYQSGQFIVRAPGTMHTTGSESGAVALLFYTPAIHTG